MSDAERIAALEARLRAMEDREAIAALIHRYAECIRLCDMAGAHALLVNEAVFELRHINPAHPGDPGRDELIHRMVGAEAIVGSRDEEAGAATMMWPMIHAVQIALDGDTATSVCLSETAIWPFGRQSIGDYRDCLLRTDEGWRFVSRHFRLFGDAAGRYASESRAVHQAQKV